MVRVIVRSNQTASNIAYYLRCNGFEAANTTTYDNGSNGEITIISDLSVESVREALKYYLRFVESIEELIDG